MSIDISGRVNIIFQNEDDIPDESVLLSGFKELNEHNYIEQSDYSDMRYIYLVSNEKNSYTLTNDEEDVYVEPDNSNDNESGGQVGNDDFNHEDYPPYIPQPEEVRYSKVRELSHICNERIIGGITLFINGNAEHFSYTEEDQTNIKELFDLALQTNVPLYYHSDDNSCKLYSVEQIVQLYTQAAMNKMHHITYFNQIKMYINTLDDCDSIYAVEYGTPLEGEFLETYNAAMAQARLGMETLLISGNILNNNGANEEKNEGIEDNDNGEVIDQGNEEGSSSENWYENRTDQNDENRARLATPGMPVDGNAENTDSIESTNKNESVTDTDGESDAEAIEGNADSEIKISEFQASE